MEPMYWTSVKDGLPKEDHFECLIMTETGIRLGEFTIDGCFHKIVESSDFGGNFNGDIYYKRDSSVTHWMPLPEIPEGWGK
jgi:hypothetical protein